MTADTKIMIVRDSLYPQSLPFDPDQNPAMPSQFAPACGRSPKMSSSDPTSSGGGGAVAR